ncbi:nuclease-related domain-containing protein [Flavihumibacter fluvii]|uniref:nuclease-related domain-containing protein n=1 Tax=Flavihumibacter fluvii TaxID=2838157 RepID=UPI001BDF3F61|nr:nuclease-related domain-containing protein [Flavihumibacter fluvii]ULQ51724.1 NERD domain-containing protein [Flavihumibacter fluvii]
MCKVHKSVGCLTTIKTHLKRHNINDFNSLNELLSFQKNFSNLRQQIISSHETLIENEKSTLAAEILQLDNAIKTDKAYFESSFLTEIEELKQKLSSLSISTGLNFIKRFVNYKKRRAYKNKLQDLELNLNYNVNYAVRELINQYQDKINRHKYITLHFSDAVKESCLTKIIGLEKKQRIIEELENSIYGALGEHKVVKELENLSDENVLINDFTLNFYPAIYNRQENDYIKSIQIDHLLVTPSGLFLIETKNWSEKSLASLDLRSPVHQVKRTNFALFKVLTEDISRGRVKLKQHHWGSRKIPIRNLIVLTNSKPNEDFQYVKILTLKELLSYIRYFKPIFTSTETQDIASYLLNLSD